MRLQQSILEMEMDDLLENNSREPQASTSQSDSQFVPGRDAVDNSVLPITSQGSPQDDVAEVNANHFNADSNKVPSSWQRVDSDVCEENSDTVSVDGDANIVAYVALCIAVVMIASVVYRHLVRK